MSLPSWLPIAVSYLGFREVGTNRGIEEFIRLAKTGELGDPWCAIFVNACLEKAGIRGSRSPTARSFETNSNFVRLSGPAVGAIVTRWRNTKASGEGHVYFYLGENSKGNVALGGNQSNQVIREYQPQSPITGYWWPKTYPLPVTGSVSATTTDPLEAIVGAESNRPAEFETLKPEFERLLSTVQLTDPDGAEAAARKVLAGKARYVEAERLTGVPWGVIGAIDWRESSCDPSASLGQGDPWNKVSTHEPKGQGPFRSWAEAAVFYLQRDKMNDLPRAEWNMAWACYKCERYNGLGPRNHGIFTPYLWCGTNHYTKGGYPSDGVWSASYVNKSPGVVAVLYQLVLLDESAFVEDDSGTTDPGVEPPPSPNSGAFVLRGTMWLQSMLNILMPASEKLLRVDGDNGTLTREAVRSFQKRHPPLVVDGDAGDLTTAEIDRQLSLLQASMEGGSMT
jgi:uncharacterized protein (TIGR02594 family)